MPSLTIQQLMTAATAAEWYAQMLADAAILNLPTTSWQSGSPEPTILAATSYALSQEDAIASIFAQGGFLDLAAQGTVTYTALDPNGNPLTVTQPVTPDPSDPSQNPNGALGLLDELADGVYDVDRLPATFASVLVSITNASASSYGPFAAGSFHIANPSTKATYSNRDPLTIGPSGTMTGVVFVADLIGPTGTSAAAAITQTVTVLAGVSVTNPAACVGNNWESNIALALRCRLSLGLLSPLGPAQAYQFVALSATQANGNIIGSPVVLAGGAITRALVILDTSNGQVNVYLAQAGGAVSSPDVALVDGLIQANCVPDTVTAVTHSATNHAITFAATAYVPANRSSQVAGDIQTAITNYLAALQIGGVNISGNVVPLDAVMGACFIQAPYIEQLTLLMNGSAADVSIANTEVATAFSISVTVHVL